MRLGTEIKSLQAVRFVEWPVCVGYYEIGATWFAIYGTKPSRFHRLMVRWILGWKWRDAASPR